MRTPDIEAGVKMLTRVVRRLGFAVLAMGMAFFGLHVEIDFPSKKPMGVWGLGVMVFTDRCAVNRA